MAAASVRAPGGGRTTQAASPSGRVARALLAALLLLLLLAPRARADDSRLVAVLPLTGASAGLPRESLVALEESIRTKAGDVLRPLGYIVMTNENTLQLLADNGVDPAKACESSCALQAGREMKARYLISAQAATNAGRFLLFVRLYDVTTGADLASLKLAGKDGGELEAAFDADADQFFAKARIQGDNIAPGTLVVTSNVPDCDVSIDGRPADQRVGPASPASFSLKPGRHQIKVSRPGFFEHLASVDVIPRERTTVAAELLEEQAAPEPAFVGGRTTLLTVKTTPRGAVVRVDGKPAGRGPLSVRVKPGTHAIEAHADFHRPAQQTVTMQEGEVLSVELTLKEAFGGLEVTSNPSGALVFLDDRQVGTATPTLAIPRLTSGLYALRLTLPDHFDHSERVLVRDGETTRVSPPALRESVGALQIETTPPGAQVFVDGVRQGPSPLTVRRLAGGAHELRLELEDYRPLVTTVTVRHGRVEPVRQTLEPAFALLSVVSSPVQGDVLVNGRKVGRTPLADLRLPEGEATVRVEGPAESYRPWEQRVRATSGRPVSLSAELRPILGRLVVVSSPPGAQIRLDGQLLGEAPLVKEDVLGGTREISASLTEHRTEKRQISVQGERETLVELALVELLPAEKAAQLLEKWKKETAPQRRNAWLATGGAATLAGLGLWQLAALSSAKGQRARLYSAYQGATEGADSAWSRYEESNGSVTAARVLSTTLLLGAGAAAAGAGWLWWKVPARPVFEIAGSGDGVAVAGTW